MAFEQNTFSPVSAGAAPSPKLYAYSTADASATVLGANYFQKKENQLDEGDYIFVNSSDVSAIYIVGSDTSTVTLNAGGGLVGPASSIDDNFLTFDGVTGQLVQDSTQNINTARGQNNIYINSPTELALHAPVSGGYHQVPANTQLIQAASFSLSQGVEYGAGSAYNSSSTLNVLTYTGSSAVFKSVDNDLTSRRITVNITGAGSLFDFTDTTGTKVLSFESSRANAVKGNGATIGAIGATTAGSTIALGAILAIGFDNPFTFDGTIGRISVSRCAFINCGNVYNLAAGATVTNGDITNTTHVTDDVGDETWIDAGATITNPIKITGCSASGPGSFNNSNLELDADYILSGNTGFKNTELAAQGYIIGNAVATVVALGVGGAVAVNFGTGYVAGIQDQFTVSNAGLYTYIGSETRIFYVDKTLFAKTAGGATRDYIYLWRKNSAVIASSSTQAQYNGTNPGSSSCKTLVELAQNDTMQLFMYQLSGALVNPTIETSSASLVSV